MNDSLGADPAGVVADPEYRLLGTLSVHRDGAAVDVGATRPQAMLATLLLSMPAPRTKQFLLDAVWGEDGPGSGERIVPAYVYGLRKALDPPGTPSESSVLRWDGTGYRLHVEPERTDVGAFLGLTEQARLARGAGETGRARRLAGAALALCRGEPVAGLPGPFLEAQRRRFTELWLSTVEQRIELDLELGEQHAVVAELQELVAEHPLREGLAANLMLALHRSGRRAEALECYARARAVLVDELGIEPGAQLQLAQQEVLRPAEPGAAPAAHRGWVRRCDLPAPPGREFTGRAAELHALLAGDGGVHTISGMPGVGKTALALRAGYDLAARYPDGQLYLDLHGHATDREPSTPAAALARLLAAVGVPAASIPEHTDERAALWRAETADRKVLLVLDDARTASQVRPLLPGGTGCRVLLTARATLPELDGPTVHLGPLAEPDAVSLLGKLTDLINRCPDPSATARIARACGGLPLALRVAAARLRSRPVWTLAELADRLADPLGRLAELVVGDLDVRAALASQVDELSAHQARALRTLADLPPEFDRPTAGRDAALLDELVELNLLDYRGGDRFALPELVRCYARTMPTTLGRVSRVVSLRDRGQIFGAPPGIAG